MSTNEIRMTRNGIELTEEQMQECRDFAVSDVLCNHRHEYEGALTRHMAAKLKALREYAESLGRP